MNWKTTAVLTVALSGTLAGVGAGSAASAAEPCVSGAEVRTEVHGLVDGLTDDVRSDRARAAVATSLIESMRTYRGQRADTAQERDELGLRIAALASRQRETANRVEGRALATAIIALTEQRERGSFTAEEQEQLRLSLAALRRAVVARTSNESEGLEVAAAFKALHEQFTCRPA